MLLDQIAQRGFRDATLTSYAGNLKLCSRRRDLRIESRGRSREQIHWNQLSRILVVQTFRVRLDAADQLLIGGAEVRAAGVGSVVSASGIRGTRMKILCSCERLPDDARPNRFPVAIAD